MNEPVDRTIPVSHYNQSKRMEQVATNGNRHPQQQPKLYHGIRPERTTDWLGTPSSSRTMIGVKESDGRRIPI
jgi:hypothetical protein